MPTEFKKRRKIVLTDPLRYDTLEDVRARLEGSYIRYRGKGVYVHRGVAPLSVVLVEPIEDENKTVAASDTDLDISTPSVGYIPIKLEEANKGGLGVISAYYVVRTNARQFKQGLSNGNCMLNVDLFGESSRDKHRLSNFSHRAICLMINNEGYETYSNAINALANKEIIIQSIPISRKYALVKGPDDLILFNNMGTSIGFVEDNRITLFDGYKNSLYVQAIRELGADINVF